MSDFQLHDGKGQLFRNIRKTADNQPDMTGKVKVGGKEWKIAAWTKTDRNGNKYMSLSFSDPNERPQRQAPTQSRAPEPQQEDEFKDDNLPF